MSPLTASQVTRIVSLLVGFGAIGVATRLNLEHTAGADPTSPMGSALVIFGFLTAACATAAPRAWGEGRRLLATLMVIAATSGELFALAASVERLALLRAESNGLAASRNLKHDLAAQALTDARQELADAIRRSSEATRGGCGPECKGLNKREADARRRVQEAETKLASMGPRSITVSPLATLLNVDPATIEIGLGALFGVALTLGGAGLVSFGTAPSNPRDTSESAGDNAYSRPGQGPRGRQRTEHGSSAEAVVELARNSSGRLEGSIRHVAGMIGKPKSSVHDAILALLAAGVLRKAHDGAGYVLTS